MEVGTIIKDYLGNRANKRRSIDSVHFELHWERDLMRLLDDINNRSLDPFIYSFIRKKPRPREVIAALMQMKIPQHHFDIIVRPLVEAELTDRTFNNRIGFGGDRAIARLIQDVIEVSRNFSRDAYIITRDIKAYFPSTDLDKAYNRYRKLIDRHIPEGEEKDDLMYILMRVNYAYPQHNVRLLSPRYEYDDIIASGKSVIFNNDYSHGGCLGNQYWQVQKNYDLADFDRWQVVDCGMHYGRFVDDMWWVVDNLQAGLAHVALSERKLLEEEGYVMHPRKRYQQHQHTVEDITNFPEWYYDATAFFTSGAYPSDKYEELLEAVRAKRTVYATIDEEGYISYVFFMSSANSDGSSSRVLLTTIFADGGNLYLNTFVLQQSGMTPLQESITGKAAKATTLAGYGIGDAYTKSEVDAAIASAITTTLNTEV